MYTIVATWTGVQNPFSGNQLSIAITHDCTIAQAIARAVWKGAIPIHTDTALLHIRIYNEEGTKVPWALEGGLS